MLEFNNVKVFTDDIDEATKQQIYEMAKSVTFEGCKMRIMPDTHCGKGSVVGCTSTIVDKVSPSVVGVDIGCGMLAVNLHTDKVDFDKLDKSIRKHVPVGREVGNYSEEGAALIDQLRCRAALKDRPKLAQAIGSLGSGNHFIAIDEDKTRNRWLIIHSGSRNLGLQVANHYRELAIKRCHYLDVQSIIDELKAQHREQEIESELEKLKASRPKVSDDLCYLEGTDLEDYLHDMQICVKFADLNRRTIAHTICVGLRCREDDSFTSVHNYISEDGYIRKGAIEAKEGQRVIIPLNMRDGCIIGIGKGNPDWNYSAPHGAGRKMSRSEAKQKISLEKFQYSMRGVWSTTVCKETLDEAPQAYKPSKEIIELIEPAVEIVEVLKEVYNFKAADSDARRDKKRIK